MIGGSTGPLFRMEIQRKHSFLKNDSLVPTPAEADLLHILVRYHWPFSSPDLTCMSISRNSQKKQEERTGDSAAFGLRINRFMIVPPASSPLCIPLNSHSVASQAKLRTVGQRSSGFSYQCAIYAATVHWLFMLLSQGTRCSSELILVSHSCHMGRVVFLFAHWYQGIFTSSEHSADRYLWFLHISCNSR